MCTEYQINLLNLIKMIKFTYFERWKTKLVQNFETDKFQNSLKVKGPKTNLIIFLLKHHMFNFIKYKWELICRNLVYITQIYS